MCRRLKTVRWKWRWLLTIIFLFGPLDQYVSCSPGFEALSGSNAKPRENQNRVWDAMRRLLANEREVEAAPIRKTEDSVWEAWRGWSICYEGKQIRRRSCKLIGNRACEGDSRHIKPCEGGMSLDSAEIEAIKATHLFNNRVEATHAPPSITTTSHPPFLPDSFDQNKLDLFLKQLEEDPPTLAGLPNVHLEKTESAEPESQVEIGNDRQEPTINEPSIPDGHKLTSLIKSLQSLEDNFREDPIFVEFSKTDKFQKPSNKSANDGNKMQEIRVHMPLNTNVVTASKSSIPLSSTEHQPTNEDSRETETLNSMLQAIVSAAIYEENTRTTSQDSFDLDSNFNSDDQWLLPLNKWGHQSRASTQKSKLKIAKTLTGLLDLLSMETGGSWTIPIDRLRSMQLNNFVSIDSTRTKKVIVKQVKRLLEGLAALDAWKIPLEKAMGKQAAKSLKRSSPGNSSMIKILTAANDLLAKLRTVSKKDTLPLVENNSAGSFIVGKPVPATVGSVNPFSNSPSISGPGTISGKPVYHPLPSKPSHTFSVKTRENVRPAEGSNGAVSDRLRESVRFAPLPKRSHSEENDEFDFDIDDTPVTLPPRNKPLASIRGRVVTSEPINAPPNSIRGRSIASAARNPSSNSFRGPGIISGQRNTSSSRFLRGPGIISEPRGRVVTSEPINAPSNIIRGRSIALATRNPSSNSFRGPGIISGQRNPSSTSSLRGPGIISEPRNPPSSSIRGHSLPSPTSKINRNRKHNNGNRFRPLGIISPGLVNIETETPNEVNERFIGFPGLTNNAAFKLSKATEQSEEELQQSTGTIAGRPIFSKRSKSFPIRPSINSEIKGTSVTETEQERIDVNEGQSPISGRPIPIRTKSKEKKTNSGNTHPRNQRTDKREPTSSKRRRISDGVREFKLHNFGHFTVQDKDTRSTNPGVIENSEITGSEISSSPSTDAVFNLGLSLPDAHSRISGRPVQTDNRSYRERSQNRVSNIDRESVHRENRSQNRVSNIDRESVHRANSLGILDFDIRSSPSTSTAEKPLSRRRQFRTPSSTFPLRGRPSVRAENPWFNKASPGLLFPGIAQAVEPSRNNERIGTASPQAPNINIQGRPIVAQPSNRFLLRNSEISQSQLSDRSISSQPSNSFLSKNVKVSDSEILGRPIRSQHSNQRREPFRDLSNTRTNNNDRLQQLLDYFEELRAKGFGPSTNGRTSLPTSIRTNIDVGSNSNVRTREIVGKPIQSPITLPPRLGVFDNADSDSQPLSRNVKSPAFRSSVPLNDKQLNRVQSHIDKVAKLTANLSNKVSFADNGRTYVFVLPPEEGKPLASLDTAKIHSPGFAVSPPSPLSPLLKGVPRNLTSIQPPGGALSNLTSIQQPGHFNPKLKLQNPSSTNGIRSPGSLQSPSPLYWVLSQNGSNPHDVSRLSGLYGVPPSVAGRTRILTGLKSPAPRPRKNGNIQQYNSDGLSSPSPSNSPSRVAYPPAYPPSSPGYNPPGHQPSPLSPPTYRSPSAYQHLGQPETSYSPHRGPLLPVPTARPVPAPGPGSAYGSETFATVAPSYLPHAVAKPALVPPSSVSYSQPNTSSLYEVKHPSFAAQPPAGSAVWPIPYSTPIPYIPSPVQVSSYPAQSHPQLPSFRPQPPAPLRALIPPGYQPAPHPQQPYSSIPRPVTQYFHQLPAPGPPGALPQYATTAPYAATVTRDYWETKWPIDYYATRKPHYLPYGVQTRQRQPSLGGYDYKTTIKPTYGATTAEKIPIESYPGKGPTPPPYIDHTSVVRPPGRYSDLAPARPPSIRPQDYNRFTALELQKIPSILGYGGSGATTRWQPPLSTVTATPQQAYEWKTRNPILVPQHRYSGPLVQTDSPIAEMSNYDARTTAAPLPYIADRKPNIQVQTDEPWRETWTARPALGKKSYSPSHQNSIVLNSAESEVRYTKDSNPYRQDPVTYAPSPVVTNAPPAPTVTYAPSPIVTYAPAPLPRTVAAPADTYSGYSYPAPAPAGPTSFLSRPALSKGTPEINYAPYYDDNPSPPYSATVSKPALQPSPPSSASWEFQAPLPAYDASLSAERDTLIYSEEYFHTSNEGVGPPSVPLKIFEPGARAIYPIPSFPLAPPTLADPWQSEYHRRKRNSKKGVS